LKGELRGSRGFIDYWFSDHAYQQVRPFGKAVLAVPKFPTQLDDNDVLAYDGEGIRLVESEGENYAASRKDDTERNGLGYFAERILTTQGQRVRRK